MAIVCGIDFSESSMRAVEAAARLAARTGAPLHLVHVLEPGHSQRQLEMRNAEIEWVERGLRGLADRAQAHGAKVQLHVEVGVADEVIAQLAERLSARLIVVAALGFRRRGSWQIGSHAERLAQRSHVPVLVVRDPKPIIDWAQGKRPLQIVLGADASRSAEHALSFVDVLSTLGPCEVTVVHLYWPPAEFVRLGLHGIRDYAEADPQVTRSLEREFALRFGRAGLTPPKLRMEPNMGRIGDRIAAVAAEEGADLVVIGTHARSVLERLIEGSVSRDVLHRARVSVACVPAPVSTPATHVTELHDVLLATDFSPASEEAVSMAYAIVAQGGTVHLLHVVPENNTDSARPHDIFAEPSAYAEIRERLSGLVHRPCSVRPVATKIHVVSAGDTALAICQAAERLDASAICLGSRGGGLSRALLGSVANAVLLNTRRPVLLARAAQV